MPPISTRSFPGNRDEPYLAGIIPVIRILSILIQGQFTKNGFFKVLKKD
jgi:hypothetical protein